MDSPLKRFYQDLFPFDQLIQLLTRNGLYPLSRIRFAFRYGEDMFVRYLTFDSKQEALDYMERMDWPDEEIEKPRKKLEIRFFHHTHLRDYVVRHVPDTINVQFPEDSRPLVFDVDMQDYPPEQRDCACPTERDICNHCWRQVMRPAMIKAKAWLCDFIGFNEVYFVFSGRKGFHIWILDERVWEWSLEGRKNYAERIPIRIDKAITQGPGHLIKVPWGVHHWTGGVCVTIEDVESFLPFPLLQAVGSKKE